MSAKEGLVTKVVEAQGDHLELVVLLAAGAIFLVIWAANGLKFTTLKAGLFEGVAQPPEMKAALGWSNTLQEPLDVSPPIHKLAKTDNVEPRGKEEGFVELHGETEAIYSLEAVPTQVIKDLLNNWPYDQQFPIHLSAFEFAARKLGEGNHPWTIKFKNLPAIRVSYGGRRREARVCSSILGQGQFVFSWH
ncbi:MAG: hypothetical protein ACOX8V_05850 [Thermoleophilia bacterium]